MGECGEVVGCGGLGEKCGVFGGKVLGIFFGVVFDEFGGEEVVELFVDVVFVEFGGGGDLV